MAVGVPETGELDANVIVSAIFVGVPTSLPLLLLWLANVRLIWGWMLIVVALTATWGWVIYEIAKPNEGGGVNFAPLSGIMICLLLCVASALIVNHDKGSRAH